MLILKPLKDIPVTKEQVLREAEKTLFQKFVDRKLRTAWQLRAHLAALGALGLALQRTETFHVLTVLLKGTWVPGSWA